MTRHPLNLLLIAPNCDGTDVGEAFCAHQWVSKLSEAANVTLLTQTRTGRRAPSEQLPGVEVVEWPELPLPARLERVTAMMKPGYPLFASRARRWISGAISSGRRIDLIHQLTPVALRYASPAHGFGIPYVLGPHAGSLSTPAAFVAECRTAPYYTRLRDLDRFRITADPWLRRTFADADCVIGVAPYVRENFGSIPLKRFEVMSELGIDAPIATGPRRGRSGTLRLLHVGRAVRTKGLRDCVRAIALLGDRSDVHLTQAGAGEELEICKTEARRLGVADRISFMGPVPRRAVTGLYEAADVFLFPSFREPSGSVVFEALGHGLPVITVDRGGPGHVVTSQCGIKVPVNDPDQMANAIAAAIQEISGCSGTLEQLSSGALRRAGELGCWPEKIRWMIDLYHSVLDQCETRKRGAS